MLKNVSWRETPRQWPPATRNDLTSGNKCHEKSTRRARFFDAPSAPRPRQFAFSRQRLEIAPVSKSGTMDYPGFKNLTAESFLKSWPVLGGG